MWPMSQYLSLLLSSHLPLPQEVFPELFILNPDGPKSLSYKFEASFYLFLDEPSWELSLGASVSSFVKCELYHPPSMVL